MYYITITNDGTTLYYLSKDYYWVFDEKRGHKFLTCLIARIIISRLFLEGVALKICPCSLIG